MYFCVPKDDTGLIDQLQSCILCKLEDGKLYLFYQWDVHNLQGCLDNSYWIKGLDRWCNSPHLVFPVSVFCTFLFLDHVLFSCRYISCLPILLYLSVIRDQISLINIFTLFFWFIKKTEGQVHVRVFISHTSDKGSWTTI